MRTRLAAGVALLGVVAVTGASAGQELPPAVADAASVESGYWTDEQLDGWIAEGEDFLATATDPPARALVLEALVDWNDWRNEKDPAPTLAILARYFAEVPDGPRNDEFDWLRVRLEHFIYEHEGNARLAIRQARAYERYLAARPDSDVVNEIRLVVGWEYHVAYEIVVDEPRDPPVYSAAEAESFRARARLLWHIAEVEAARRGQSEIADRARYYLDSDRVHIMPRHQPDGPD